MDQFDLFDVHLFLDNYCLPSYDCKKTFFAGGRHTLDCPCLGMKRIWENFF